MKKIFAGIAAIALTMAMFTGCEKVDKDQYVGTVSPVSQADDSVEEAEDNAAEDEADAEEEQVGQLKNLDEGANSPLAEYITFEPTNMASAVWSDMTLMIDETAYNLACDYQEFANAGWSYDPGFYGLTNYKVDPGSILSRSIYLNHENYTGGTICVGFTNTGSSTVDIENCQVWSVEMNIRDLESYPEIILPGDVRMGMPYNQIREIYGEPSETTRDDVSGFTCYKYSEDATKALYLTVYDDIGLGAFAYEKF